MQKGAADKHPFAATVIPPSPANLAVLEDPAQVPLQSRLLQMQYAIWALCYAGKWQQANEKADEFIAASDAASLPLAVEMKWRVLNGQAASPTAANSFLETLK